jgi:hypothetical protein
MRDDPFSSANRDRQTRPIADVIKEELAERKARGDAATKRTKEAAAQRPKEERPYVPDFGPRR